MSNAGIVTNDPIVVDGKLHRFHVEGDKPGSKNGWSIAFPDGIPAGAFGSWRTGVSETWCAKETSSLSPQERDAFTRRMKAAKAEREREEKRRQAEAQTRAQKIWEDSKPAPDSHPYLKKKQVKPHGLRIRNGDSLVVPLRDSKGTLRSLQFIDKNGEKRFLAGGKVSGCYYSLGKPNGVIYITEGLSTAATVHESSNGGVSVAFNAGNLAPVAKALKEKYSDATLVIAGDNDYQTEGNPGRVKAIEAARAVGGLVALPTFKNGQIGTDWNDLFIAEGMQVVKQQLEAAAPPPLSDDTRAEIDIWLKSDSTDLNNIRKALQSLDTLQYDQVRNKIADHAGIRVPTLDGLVKNAGRDRGIEVQGGSIGWEEIVPWPEPVDGAQLLDELVSTFQRYLILPEGAAEFIALWSVHTHAHEAAYFSPNLVLSSPEKRCGKTRVLEVFSGLIPRPILASNVTSAVVFRLIEKYRPTLILDENDTFLKIREELRGILNAGHSRKLAYVYRAVGDDYEPRKFSVWAPKALALIGNLPDTVADRSIIIHMRRKTTDERVQRFREDKAHEILYPLCQKAARWVSDHFNGIKDVEPEVPGTLNDRAQDNWRPLLSIADIAGGKWPERARQAAETLSGYGDTDSDSFKVQLLEDIQAAIKEIGNPDKIKTEDLLRYLNSLEDHPWCEWKKGNPMSARNLSTLLRPFGIKSKDHRFDGEVKKGYSIFEFKESFRRYLPPQSATSATGLTNNNLGEIQSATEPESVADKNSRNPCIDNCVADVADRNPMPGERNSVQGVRCGDCCHFIPDPVNSPQGNRYMQGGRGPIRPQRSGAISEG